MGVPYICCVEGSLGDLTSGFKLGGWHDKPTIELNTKCYRAEAV